MNSTNGTRRGSILAAADLREEQVTVPEWGNVTLLARGFTGRQRSEFAGKHQPGQPTDFGKALTDILIAGLFDPETREPVFTDADRDALLAKSGDILDRLSKVILKLSGLSDDAVGVAQKNF